MKGKKYTQTQQVIDTLRQQGGYATLGNMYQIVDASTWATKTPQESIRRIVQQSPNAPNYESQLLKEQLKKKYGDYKHGLSDW